MKTIRSFDFIAAGIDFDILEHPLDGCGGNRLNSYKYLLCSLYTYTDERETNLSEG